MSFTYGVKLPGFNNKKIWVKEVTAKDYKDLVKSLYNNDPTEFLHHLNQVIEHVSPGILQEGLNVVDKVILLLQIRSICISPDLKLKANCTDTKREFEYTVKIEDLISKLENISYNQTVTYEYTIVNHSVIKAKDELYFVGLETERYFSYTLASCIDSLSIRDKTVNFKELEFNDRIKIVDTLPFLITTKIYKSITTVEETLNNIKLLVILSPFTKKHVVNLPVSTNTNVLLDFCKLVFNDDLINLYKLNLSLVSKANFTPDYVDSITPAEQLLYWTLFVQQVEKENSDSNTILQNKQTTAPGFDGKAIDLNLSTPSEFT
jgi:hypothetical protein